MIKSFNKMESEVREKMRGGNGSVKITHLFKPDEMGGKVRMMAYVILEPGASIGEHPHDNEEEIYFIIKGKGEVNDNGNIQVVNVGDAVLTGGGNSHSIKNIGNEPLEFTATILLH